MRPLGGRLCGRGRARPGADPGRDTRRCGRRDSGRGEVSRRRGLSPFPSADLDGPDPPADPRHRRGRKDRPPPDHQLQQCRDLAAGRFPHRGAAQFRPALFQPLARPERRAGGGPGARYRRAVPPHADARDVDRHLRRARPAHRRRNLCLCRRSDAGDPAPPDRAPISARLQRIGFGPGADFDLAAADPVGARRQPARGRGLSRQPS